LRGSSASSERAGRHADDTEDSIVFLDRETIPPHTILRRPSFPHLWTEHLRTTPAEVSNRCRDATIVIVNKVKVTADSIAQMPRLRLVAVAATGTDPVDLKACAERGIVVSNIRNYAAEFAQMKRRPLLINTARGGLVSEEDLVVALRQGQVAGAAFDVATVEPPPADHALMQLVDLPNFILTPHVAWASAEAIQTLADQLIDNIEAFHAGRPQNVVH
jgi:lactate dehydrogenase-like 2-hydroxyacid dehydrogenase